MKAPFAWERIDTPTSSNDESTCRAKVEGGWLVNHVVYPNNVEALMVMTTTFVPDPQHQWIVDNNPSMPCTEAEFVGASGVQLDKWNTPVEMPPV